MTSSKVEIFQAVGQTRQKALPAPVVERRLARF